MSSPCRASLLLLALLASGCDREQRDPRGEPLPETEPIKLAVINPKANDPRATNYQDNAMHVSNGQLYFHWMNCTGCHSEGGGGIGPALMDTKWRYGSSMESIVETIAHGRPNGMPAFSGKMTPAQIWEVAAYVRSMSAHVPQSIRGGRSEGLSAGEPPTLRDPHKFHPVTPKQDEATVEQ
jgi:cytochrome c oxidase cbb3-type subunit 3